MTAKQLRNKFDKDLKKLQNTCPHKKSKWMEYHWAIGHWSGTMVNVCLSCEKTLETKNEYESLLNEQNSSK